MSTGTPSWAIRVSPFRPSVHLGLSPDPPQRFQLLGVPSCRIQGDLFCTLFDSRLEPEGVGGFELYPDLEVLHYVTFHLVPALLFFSGCVWTSYPHREGEGTGKRGRVHERGWTGVAFSRQKRPRCQGLSCTRNSCTLTEQPMTLKRWATLWAFHQ